MSELAVLGFDGVGTSEDFIRARTSDPEWFIRPLRVHPAFDPRQGAARDGLVQSAGARDLAVEATGGASPLRAYLRTRRGVAS